MEAQPEQEQKPGKRSRIEAALVSAPSPTQLASLAALQEEAQPGRKRTHDELVQLLGADAPAAPNRKKRREELQSKRTQKRLKAAAKIAKGGKEAQEEAAAQLSDKAKAKLAAKAARHERDNAKIVKRRKRHALRDAENERRVKRGLAPLGPAPSQTEAPVKAPKMSVARGKFSTARTRKVKSEKAKQKKQNVASSKSKKQTAASGV